MPQPKPRHGSALTARCGSSAGWTKMPNNGTPAEASTTNGRETTKLRRNHEAEANGVNTQ